MTDAHDATGNAQAEALCNWCGVNPVQRPNGECDGCWHLPGHEGEYEPTLEEEAHAAEFAALLADRDRLAREREVLAAFVQKVIDECSKVRVLYEQAGFGTPEEYSRLHDYAICSDALEIDAEILLSTLSGSEETKP